MYSRITPQNGDNTRSQFQSMILASFNMIKIAPIINTKLKIILLIITLFISNQNLIHYHTRQ